MRTMVITAGSVSLHAELNNSRTAEAIWEALPIEGRANRWGDEIYFEVPVNMPEEEDAREAVAVGELAYWPVGRAFCIFFGRTPVSTDEQPRAYSPVNIVGKVVGDTTQFRAVHDGDHVELRPLALP